MTDADRFTRLLAAFPIDSEALERIHDEAVDLLSKAQNGPPQGEADGTMSTKDWYQLRAVTWALRDLRRAVEIIERDEEPDDDIPF